MDTRIKRILGQLSSTGIATNLLSQIKEKRIESLDGVVDLLIEKAINEPQSSWFYAVLCSRLPEIQDSNSSEKVSIESIDFGSCSFDFGSVSFDVEGHIRGVIMRPNPCTGFRKIQPQC